MKAKEVVREVEAPSEEEVESADADIFDGLEALSD